MKKVSCICRYLALFCMLFNSVICLSQVQVLGVSIDQPFSSFCSQIRNKVYCEDEYVNNGSRTYSGVVDFAGFSDCGLSVKNVQNSTRISKIYINLHVLSVDSFEKLINSYRQKYGNPVSSAREWRTNQYNGEKYFIVEYVFACGTTKIVLTEIGGVCAHRDKSCKRWTTIEDRMHSVEYFPYAYSLPQSTSNIKSSDI